MARRTWLSEQRFEFAAQQQTFDSYVHAVDLVDRRIEQLERVIRGTADQGPWRTLVARLRCLRGIDTLTALSLVAEIGDFDRVKSAEEFMAFVGVVPSERSSGERRRQGSNHQESATGMCAACWSGRPGMLAGGRRSATNSPAAAKRQS